jgi:hypothetical protein
LDHLQEIFNQVEGGLPQERGSPVYLNPTTPQHQQSGNLNSLFQIYRNLLALNERELIEVLMNENYWRTTFGALEYDPEVTHAIQD